MMRLARALASPIGVLVTLPLLVIAVGIGILLVGRDATLSAAHQMARRQLTASATSVQSDFAFALDQADPLLARLRTLADPARPLDEVLVRMHALLVGRPGVAYMSISFADGTFRGAYIDGARVAVQESRLTAGGTDVQRFSIDGDKLVPLKRETTDYDPRNRGFYRLAATRGARAWTEPYTFFQSHETGITCAEPVYDAAHTLTAVLTVDFDVGALSQYVARPALDQARSVVYTRDGVILAYPAIATLNVPASDQPLRHADLKDPAIEALFATAAPDDLVFRELDAYLTAVAPVGGRRAGVAVPLDWYVATIVPTESLLGPTHALERSSVLASAAALAIAVGLALILAWNLVRMRRQVAASREEARSAEARARELGSYRLVARLGVGGMGEVWRAEHRLLARSAAIKVIRPEAMHDAKSSAEIRERFRREAQTLASMRSRHTIAIFDYGVTEASVFYYVMELLDGLDLESLVLRHGAQPAARVIDMMIQACASLAEAHDAGLLHRDIKPPNLVLSRAADELDIIKLLDFGIVQTVTEPGPLASDDAERPTTPERRDRAARIAERDRLRAERIERDRAQRAERARRASQARIELTPKLTQAGAMLGTPGFMAPEQILGMQLDGRADLYALGCVAWWLLTGREVFERTGAEAKILHRHIYDPAPRLSTVMKTWCPPELDAALAACLAKECDDRPASARALSELLRAIPIPDEHAWTYADAQAWWAEYQPAAAEAAVSESAVQVIMPGRTDQRPVAATSDSAIAHTLAANAEVEVVSTRRRG